jgi:hypothetical protein
MAPYGTDKKLGGDSKENVEWMEKCVSGISGKNSRTGKPYSEGEKIAICKSQHKKSKESKSELSEQEVLSVQEEVSEVSELLKSKILKIKPNLTPIELEDMKELYFQKANYNLDLLKFIII